MAKATAVCLFLIALSSVESARAFEVGETVVALRDFDLRVGDVVVKRVEVGEPLSVLAVDGQRLLIEGAGPVWTDGKNLAGLQDAVEAFAKRIKNDPADWVALCGRGRALEELNQPYSARKDLDEAVRVKPCCFTYRRRGGVYASRGQNEAALRDFNEAIRCDPHSTMALRERGVVLAKLHQFEKSLADLDKAIEIEPTSAYLLTCRGHVLLNEDLPEKALADADKALRLVPTYLYARSLRGFVLHAMSRNQEATDVYTGVLQEYPGYFEVLVDRGCAWSEIGCYEKAIADFSKAIEQRPHPALLVFRGIAYSSIKDFARAEADLNQAIKLQPDNTQTLMARGLLKHKMGDSKRALQDLGEAIRLEPDEYQLFFARVMVLGDCDRHEEALKDCEQLIRLRPKSSKSYLYRGVERSLLHQWDEAVGDVDRALQLDANDAEVLAHYALVRAACPVERLRDPKDALVRAKRAAELSQGKSLAALRALAAAHAAGGDFDKAMDAQKQAISLADPEDRKEEEEQLARYEAKKPYRFK